MPSNKSLSLPPASYCQEACNSNPRARYLAHLAKPLGVMSISSAIAYLKCDESLEDDEEPILVSEDNFPAHLSYGNGLTCYYLVNMGDRFEYVMNRHLAKYGETEQSLHAKALENLASLIPGQLTVRSFGSAYGVMIGGNFEASLLLVDELWDKTLSHTIENDYIAAIPARDVLAYCDSSSVEGLAALRRAIENIWPTGDHLVSKKLYRRASQEWAVYDA